MFPGVRDGLQAFTTAITIVKRDREAQPLRVTTTNAFASRWLVPRLAGWKKTRPAIPNEVIGTDAVLDLYAGDTDVAIRYAPTTPRDGNVIKLFTDTFLAGVQSAVLADGRLRRAGDLRKCVLIHCWWSPADRGAPTWQRWLTIARSKWRDVPKFDEMAHLSFREELHGIEAIIAGEGIGICSDALVANDLKKGVSARCCCRSREPARERPQPRIPRQGRHLAGRQAKRPSYKLVPGSAPPVAAGAKRSKSIHWG